MTGSDGLTALLLGLGFALLYLATGQARLNADAVPMLEVLRLYPHLSYHHALWIPACRALDAIVSSDDPVAVPRILSSLSAALAVGLTYPLCLRLGAARGASAFATTLLGLTPAVWFFATTVEVHALHMGAVALAAVVTFSAPWRRPALALAISAAVFPLLVLSHRSAVLLGPGWVLLVGAAAAAQGVRLSLARVLLVVGPVLLAVMALTLCWSNWLAFGEFTLRSERELGFVGQVHASRAFGGLVTTGWLLPLLALVPLAVVGAVRGGHLRYALPAQVLLLLPPLAFFLWWGVDEKGGYFLGTAPFLAALAARGVHGLGRAHAGLWRVAGLLVLAGTLVESRHFVRAFDDGFDPADRVAAVREAFGAEAGTVVSVQVAAPSIAIWIPGTHEIQLLEQVREPGAEPEALTQRGLVALEPYLGRVAVALDLSNPQPYDRPGLAAVTQPFLDALERGLEERFATHRVTRGSWTLLVLDGERR